MRVVDALEVVDVHHHQRQRRLIALGALHHAPPRVFESAAIRQAGEGVGVGLRSHTAQQLADMQADQAVALQQVRQAEGHHEQHFARVVALQPALYRRHHVDGHAQQRQADQQQLGRERHDAEHGAFAAGVTDDQPHARRRQQRDQAGEHHHAPAELRRRVVDADGKPADGGQRNGNDCGKKKPRHRPPHEAAQADEEAGAAERDQRVAEEDRHQRRHDAAQADHRHAGDDEKKADRPVAQVRRAVAQGEQAHRCGVDQAHHGGEQERGRHVEVHCQPQRVR